MYFSIYLGWFFFWRNKSLFISCCFITVDCHPFRFCTCAQTFFCSLSDENRPLQLCNRLNMTFKGQWCSAVLEVWIFLQFHGYTEGLWHEISPGKVKQEQAALAHLPEPPSDRSFNLNHLIVSQPDFKRELLWQISVWKSTINLNVLFLLPVTYLGYLYLTLLIFTLKWIHRK